MKLSVLTPTGDRELFLKKCYELLLKQDYPDWEWLVFDTSLRPVHFEDPRVTYIHSNEILTIGKKRERLIEHMTGDVIVYFDDDDFYAPSYLSTVARALEDIDFLSFHAWFSYDLSAKEVYYSDRSKAAHKHYIMNPLAGASVSEVQHPPGLKSACLQYSEGMDFLLLFIKRCLISVHFQIWICLKMGLYVRTFKNRVFVVRG